MNEPAAKPSDPGESQPKRNGLPPAPRPPRPEKPSPQQTEAGDHLPTVGNPKTESANRWQNPQPADTRWKPLRGGLINLFKYTDQVFEYADGRLLLRGDNGSGKSRVLALQLPFLLDGELNPRRVEPDRDPAKKVEWNLLMDRHESRLGYTWIEFQRIADGVAETLTLGCGLHARKGSDLKRWFFITPHRVRHDLQLLRNKTPLTERQLREHLEELGAGTLYKKAGDYRIAIDQQLFRLGDRYRPLVDLLIQLRQPQLMRDMKEDVLSNALSEALAPIDSGLISQVAESFRGLESDRQRTDEYRATLDSVDSFREAYRQYLATAIRRLCKIVRLSHSSFESATKDARKVEQSLDELRGTIARDQDTLTATRSVLAGLEAEIQTLQASPEMRGKRDLDAAVQAAERAAASAAEATRQRERDEAAHQKAQAEHRERDDARTTALDQLQAVARDLRREHDSIAPRHGSALDFLDADGWPDATAPSPAALRDGLRDMTERRRRAVEQLEQRNRELRDTRATLDSARDHVARTREQVGEATTAAENRQAERDGGVTAFGRAVREWEAKLTALTAAAFPREQPWQEAVDAWLEDHIEGESPFDIALTAARDSVADALAADRAENEQKQREIGQERAVLEAELASLRDGRHPEPSVPHTRGQRDPGRAGAPFWKLVDFHPNVPAAEHAGWEAALEAAGLLDAWVLPDGRLDATGIPADDFLLAETPGLSALPVEHSLAAIFQAEADAAVPVGVVTALLHRVGNHVESAVAWIASDGQWANGPRRGHWQKEHVEFVGLRAREAARQRRIADCEAALAELARRASELAEALAAIKAQREALSREVDTAPKTQPLLQFAASLNAAREQLRAAQNRLGEAEERETAASQAWQDARDRRDKDATDLDLTEVAEPDALRAFKEKLAAFEQRAIAFWPVWDVYRRAVVELARAQDRLASTAADLERQRASEESAREEATRTRSRADTLQATVGAGVEKVMALLATAKGNRAENETSRDRLDRSVRDGEKEEAKLEERSRSTEEKRQAASDERLRAIGRMEEFVAYRLFEEVDPTVQPDRETFSPTAAVDLARRLEKQLVDHPLEDAHWNNLESELMTRYQEFTDQVGRQGHMPSLEKIDESGISVIRCDHDGQPRTLFAFSRILREELQSRERFFEEREREVIENHLIGEAAHALQRRIRDGEEWVAKVNRELEKAHTSSGIRLRFKWRVADTADPDLPELRKLFLRSSAAWSPEERQRIANFLQVRIAAARESDDNAMWRDVLGQALDYRHWHRFDIERKKEGETAWRRLTKTTFGTGSGGEKAVTLTVPQFAAAAAHYQSADPNAPRLILLDEVFAGIDSPTRARLMELLETFDLDYVMTSQLEWGAYPEVSSLAIYQLASRPTSSAVAVTRWLWNGRKKVEVPEETVLNDVAVRSEG